MCLDSNYSKFDLPYKGKANNIKIGNFMFSLKFSELFFYSLKNSDLWSIVKNNNSSPLFVDNLSTDPNCIHR